MSLPEYRERLLPRWWAWLVAYALIGMLAVAYGGALGVAPGLAVAIGGVALATWLLWITSPVVAVDGDSLHAAAARLPTSAIRAARAVDRRELQDIAVRQCRREGQVRRRGE